MPLPPPQSWLSPAKGALDAVAGFFSRRRNGRIVARIAGHQQAYVRGQLHDKLVGDGFELAGGPRTISSTEVDNLLGTFRVEHPDDDGHLVGSELLHHLSDRTQMAYLLDAPPGEGKTTFALALAAHRPKLGRKRLSRRGLAVLYLNVAEPNFTARLQRWVDKIDHGKRAAGGHLDVIPMIMLDGVNETHSLEAVGAAIEKYLPSLRSHRARLVFLFSHRHRAYAGQLRQKLMNVGMEAPTVLKFALLSRTSGEQSAVELGFYPSHVQRALEHYAAAHPDWSLTRADGAALMRWLRDHHGAEVNDAPPPAVLVAEQFITQAMHPQRGALHDLATAAFGMLGEEAVTRPFKVLDKRLGGDAKRRLRQAKVALASTPLGDRVHIHGDTVQIDSEQAIRVLGGLYVAQRLHDGDPPTRLSGRTAYDVAAPFVSWALPWLVPTSPVGELLEREIGHQLTREDRPAGEMVPYSFYGRVLLAGDAPHTSDGLKVALFRSIIDAIDRDRQFTCKVAIVAAKRPGDIPQADPVLDQLFALVDSTSPAAMPALLDVMDGDRSAMTDADLALVRSQVAYLLVAWLNRLPTSALTHEQRRCLTMIAGRMWPGDPSLHLRYHQAEIVGCLLERADETQRADVRKAAAKVAGAELVLPPGAPDAYAALHAAVSERVNGLTDGLARPGVDAWVGATDTMREIVDRPVIGRMDHTVDQNLRLECWEVALGLSAVAFRDSGDQALGAFVLGALTHDLWIVRWWAYTGVIDMFRFVAREDQTREAEELGRCIVDRLVASDEPVGLKQQQCALVEQLLAEETGRAIDFLRKEIAGRRHEIEHKDFARPYRQALGQVAESYLHDFLARVRRLPVDGV